MRFYSLEKRLNNYSIFTIKEVARITGKPPAYCKVYLNRLVNGGKILRVERGKYCLTDADPYTIASNIIFPAYVSFLSALAFHRLTLQVPVEIQVACTRQKKPLLFGGMRIVFVKLKKSAMFGFGREGNTFVAEPEKALIDCLYLPRGTPLSESFYAIKQKEVSREKLEEYAEKLGSTVVKKRLGFLLEAAGIRTLLKPRPNAKYDLFNPLLPERGEKNKKWRLIINEVLE